MGFLEKIISLAGINISEPVAGTGAVDAVNPKHNEFPEYQKTLFESIFKNIPDALVMSDSERRIIMCNPAMKTVFGYDEAELLGQKTKILYENPEEFERQGQLRYNLSAKDKPKPYTVTYRRKNGELFSGETIGTPVLDDSGTLIGFMGVIRDITWRLQSEQNLRNAHDELESRVEERTRALQESEQRFRSVTDGSPTGVTLVGADGKILLVNRTIAAWMRSEPSNFESKTIHDIFPKDQADDVDVMDQKVLETGEDIVAERQRSFKDGVTRTVMVHKSAVRSQAGDIIAISTILSDITEQKIIEEGLKRRTEDLSAKIRDHMRAEEALRINELRSRLIMENIVEAVITINENGIIESFNQAAEKMFGYTTDEILGENVSLLTEEPDRSNHDRYVADYIRTGKAKIIDIGFREVTGKCKDATLFPAELAVSEIKGRERKFVGTLRDITERKAVQEKIRVSEARLYEAQRIARLGNWEWNIKTGALYWSDEIFKIFGLDLDTFEPTYEAFLDTVHPDDRKLVEWTVQGSLSEHKKYDIDHRILLPDGVERYVNEQGEVLFSPTGDPLLMTGTVQDITERKAAEEALVRTMEQAEMANRVKTEFLAHMSHELRTPLNAILGYSEMIKSEIFGPLGSDKYGEYIGNINDAGGHLLGLLSDVMDVSKVEAGELDIEDEEVDIAAILKDCRAMMLERADIAHVSLSSKTPGDLPRLRADGRRLRQILLNLMSNAIKFTPEKGKVVVNADVNNAGSISIRVSDTGIGIDPADLDSVLIPFRQVKEAYVSNPGEGSGLGLSLVNSLMILHGGSLDIDSAPGKGTRVTISFPPERTLAKV